MYTERSRYSGSSLCRKKEQWEELSDVRRMFRVFAQVHEFSPLCGTSPADFFFPRFRSLAIARFLREWEGGDGGGGGGGVVEGRERGRFDRRSARYLRFYASARSRRSASGKFWCRSSRRRGTNRIVAMENSGKLNFHRAPSETRRHARARARAHVQRMRSSRRRGDSPSPIATD